MDMVVYGDTWRYLLSLRASGALYLYNTGVVLYWGVL